MFYLDNGHLQITMITSDKIRKSILHPLNSPELVLFEDDLSQNHFNKLFFKTHEPIKSIRERENSSTPKDFYRNSIIKHAISGSKFEN